MVLYKERIIIYDVQRMHDRVWYYIKNVCFYDEYKT